ncbi:MAG: dienelactone hydrolase [Hydrogenophaga sp.]|uniref:alpha/beta hydrolase family protein n=2 Tax=Hydrogenophaga sp. TaxID=1904254 RepID=UPI001DBFDBDD|nr:dienelactone hydrolase [Hydrogenophaga sp.]MBW0171505.1 dienelactone hydrolase [Hydrogenophaga sp.]MBW0185111.1 dienelactone hydrolase [Hydrogenophaga sp.]
MKNHASPTTRLAAVTTPLRSLRLKWQHLLVAVCAVGSTAVHAQVGMRQIPVGTLPVTLVYPTDATAQPLSVGAFTLNVALNAPPKAQRHRLIVMSHGTGGSPVPDHDLAAALARAGFVVAQPLHEGDNYRDSRLAGPDSMARRPSEVVRVIDALSRDPQWSSRLQLDRVGVHGMSAGGVTGLSLAGGQWRLLNLTQHCNAQAQADEAFCFQGAQTPEKRAERQARFDRAAHWPEFVLPAELKTLHGGRTPTAEQPDPRPDPRVASVTLAVPVAVIFSPESLARIRIPVGVVSADQDEVLVPRFHATRLLTHCKACTQLADLKGAGHFDVLSPWPASVAREVAAQQVRGGLPVPGFDARQREAAHAKIVDFHRQHLQPLP